MLIIVYDNLKNNVICAEAVLLAALKNILGENKANEQSVLVNTLQRNWGKEKERKLVTSCFHAEKK